PAAPKAPAAGAGGAGGFTLSLGGYGSFKAPIYNPKPGDQVVPFSRKRRITADHMVYSKLTSPHVVTVAEVDLHNIMKQREAFKGQYKKEGIGLTVLSYVCQAAVKALRAYPGVNARVLDGATAILKDINLGVAVDAPDGLVVPNIKHADELSLKGLARSIGELAGRARDNKLTPDDFSGATFTVTNPGPKGNLFGGAIISQPNVAILRMGEIKKRVVVIEENGEDRIVIHPVMYLALSYDHRVIDGVLGNDFLWMVADLLRKGQFEA
ncbi:MAG: 2-oxo acid dehydrogenase subunit E2, partial [Myxococcales bacterium]